MPTPLASNETTTRRAPRALEFAVRLLRVRVVQFALLGGALFALSARATKADDAIVLTRVDLAARHEAEAARTGAAAPAAAEVDERAIEDEILYREGRKLGLDKDDTIVRQRVIQKTLYLAEELAGAGDPPTEVELRRFYDDTRTQWQKPGVVHFAHIYARERSTLEALRPEASRRLAAGESTSSLGEPSPVPAEASLTSDRVAAVLGNEFATALAALVPGGFGEPIHSALGWHVVRVVGREPGGQASFEEAAPSLVGVYVVKRRQDAIATFLERAFRGYHVTIDGRPVAKLTRSHRLAVRTSGSAED